MKKNILSYYTVPFFGFLVLYLLKAVFSDSKNSLLDNVLLAVMVALIGSIVAGTLYFFYDTRWGPNKRKKMFSKSPFKELREHGFQENEKFLWGLVNGYTVVVSYVWFTGKPAININVLFHPKSLGQFLSAEEMKEISKRNKPGSLFNAREYIWQKNAVGDLMEYNFKPPSYDKVMDRATELTDILRKENLKPITMKESETLEPEMNESIKENK